MNHRVPLIADLTSGPIPPGTSIMVEYDPASEWYNASLTIAAGWLRQGGKVSYNVSAQLPDNIRAKLNRLGINVEQLERDEKLRVWDWYTIQLGLKSKEQRAATSLKIADVSIDFARDFMRRPPQPGQLIVVDDESFMARHNDEKSWVEFEITRDLPANRARQRTAIHGYTRGVHSDWPFKSLEAAHEAVVDFKLDETSDPPRNLIRIRSFRNVRFDGRWHPLKIGENFEVTLEN